MKNPNLLILTKWDRLHRRQNVGHQKVRPLDLLDLQSRLQNGLKL